MRQARSKAGSILAAPLASAAVAEPSAANATELTDFRFRALLGAEAWSQLPAAVQRRFSKRLCDGATAVYAGQVLEIEVNWAGRLLAWAAKAIGGPLPLVWSAPHAAVVTVTEDIACRGQVWSRLYARPRGFPQVAHSSKRFAGPTGLEEYLGWGVGMALRASVEHAVLTFRSDHYFLSVGGRRLRLPQWLGPGRLTVTHAELGDGRFTFTLEITHTSLGRLIYQRAIFADVEA